MGTVAGEAGRWRVHDDGGFFSITTPVAAVEALTMPAGRITIVSDGTGSISTITNVALEAFTGRSWAGRTRSRAA